MKRSTWPVRMACIVLLALWALLPSGCGEEAARPAKILLPSAAAPAEDAVPKDLQVDVYWDATESMRGFTALAAGNAYRSLPDELEDIGSAMGAVSFYRFGEEIQPLSGREHRRFSDPAYYTELVTAMHHAVDAAEPGHLSVIVTDLFESASDWSNLARKLREKYFSRHLSVAVIGIKSSFSGDIFDVGLSAAKHRYDSGSDPARFRPFYLFVMGRDAAVRDFLERWHSRQSRSNEMRCLLFSDRPGQDVWGEDGLSIQGGENLFENDALGLHDKRAKELGVDDPDRPARLSVGFRYSPRAYDLPADMGAWKTTAQAMELAPSEESPDGWEWRPVEPPGDLAASVALAGSEAGSYEIAVSFTPGRTLAHGRVNLLHVEVAPAGYRLPDWAGAWDMADVDTDPQGFDGSKTPHLCHILESLLESSARPALAAVNLVVEGE